MIQLIVGPMFSGKSSEMLRRIQRESIAKRSVVIIRATCDVRGILTHDDKASPFKEIHVSKLFDIGDGIADVEVIAIDEGQFFDDLVEFANLWANRGKKIIISALNGTSEQKQFKSVRDLYVTADKIDHFCAVCSECGSDHAAFTYFIDGEKDDYRLVGASDYYAPLCRACLVEKGTFKTC